MGHDSYFILHASEDGKTLKPEKWNQYLLKVDFDFTKYNKGYWGRSSYHSYSWFSSIYDNDVLERWDDNWLDVHEVSKQLPNLEIRFRMDERGFGDYTRWTFLGGKLISKKCRLGDKHNILLVLKKKHPADYYDAKRQLEKPQEQKDKYEIKRFLRGISIMRDLFHKNAVVKIQRVWDRYWYKPNEHGESKAALKGYKSLTGPTEAEVPRPSKRYRVRFPSENKYFGQCYTINGHRIYLNPTVTAIEPLY